MKRYGYQPPTYTALGESPDGPWVDYEDAQAHALKVAEAVRDACLNELYPIRSHERVMSKIILRDIDLRAIVEGVSE